MNQVFLLWHVHEIHGSEEEILVGVYRSEADAKLAIDAFAISQVSLPSRMDFRLVRTN